MSMAGKSGRSINNVPESPIRKTILSWEGILVLVLVGVNIFCARFSDVFYLWLNKGFPLEGKLMIGSSLCTVVPY